MKCEIIRDLLPLYVDGACSEESRKAVEEHIAGCEACRQELGKMKRGVDLDVVEEEVELLKEGKRSIEVKARSKLESTLILVNLIMNILLLVVAIYTIFEWSGRRYETANEVLNARVQLTGLLVTIFIAPVFCEFLYFILLWRKKTPYLTKLWAFMFMGVEVLAVCVCLLGYAASGPVIFKDFIEFFARTTVYNQ